MNSTKIRILKQMDEKRLGGLLQRLDRLALPAQLLAQTGREHGQCDFADEAREGQFEEEEVGGSLVAADFLEGDGAGSVAAGFAGWGGVAGWMGGFLVLGGLGGWVGVCVWVGAASLLTLNA